MGDGADMALSDMMDAEDLRVEYKLGHLEICAAIGLGILDEHGVLEDIKDKQENDLDVICPVCGSPMVLRDGRFGEFWGCTNFPKCRGTRNKS